MFETLEGEEVASESIMAAAGMVGGLKKTLSTQRLRLQLWPPRYGWRYRDPVHVARMLHSLQGRAFGSQILQDASSLYICTTYRHHVL
jgi:hypothetical protein